MKKRLLYLTSFLILALFLVSACKPETVGKPGPYNPPSPNPESLRSYEVELLQDVIQQGVIQQGGEPQPPNPDEPCCTFTMECHCVSGPGPGCGEGQHTECRRSLVGSVACCSRISSPDTN